MKLAGLIKLQDEVATFRNRSLPSQNPASNVLRLAERIQSTPLQRSQTLDRSLKFTQTLQARMFGELELNARRRGITVQELFRAVIRPKVA